MFIYCSRYYGILKWENLASNHAAKARILYEGETITKGAYGGIVQQGMNFRIC